MSIWVKICGVTSTADAMMVAAAGAQAIGLNFVPSSKRRVEVEQAKKIVSRAREQYGKAVEFIGVFADQAQAHVLEIAQGCGLDGIQLHGGESPTELTWFIEQNVFAYKALGIATAGDVASLSVYPGAVKLVDAKVDGELGGTGRTFDWSLARELNQSTKLILAGGLTPDNVGHAISALGPYGVDTASGVEVSPGVKDEQLVRTFIQRCRESTKTFK